MISFIDLAPTVLDICMKEIPENMEGVSFITITIEISFMPQQIDLMNSPIIEDVLEIKF